MTLAAAADADCPCISRSNTDASGEPNYPKCNNVDYPDSVGISCDKWDKDTDPGCAGETGGWSMTFGATGTHSCKTLAKKSSYFPNLKTTGGKLVCYSLLAHHLRCRCGVLHARNAAFPQKKLQPWLASCLWHCLSHVSRACQPAAAATQADCPYISRPNIGIVFRELEPQPPA